MHRDGLGDDHLFQHTALQSGAVARRGRAAAAPAGKQRMGRNPHIAFLGDAAGGHCTVGGQKRQPGHRLLAVKHLHAFHPHRLPSVLFGHQVIHGIGPHRGVGLVQAVRTVGRGQARLQGNAVFVGFQAVDGHTALIQNGHPHPRQRRGLFGQGRRDPYTASRHR